VNAVLKHTPKNVLLASILSPAKHQSIKDIHHHTPAGFTKDLEIYLKIVLRRVMQS